MNKGYTLIETLIVILVFAVIGLIASETLILTLRGTSKATSVSKVRQTMDFAIGSMERQLRGAQTITSACNGTPQTNINFIDQNKNAINFSCNYIDPAGILPSEIASNSSKLIDSTVSISKCEFTCFPKSGSVPSYIKITITANDLNEQSSSITDTTQVTLRSY